MKRRIAAAAVAHLLATAALAQPGPPYALPVGDFFGCVQDGHVHIALDPQDGQDCTVGGGSAAPHFCICESGVYTVDVNPALFVLKAGDTMTGALGIGASPSSPLDVTSAATTTDIEITSTGGGLSSWALRANSGVDGFLAVDRVAGTTPLRIGGGAPSNSFRVESSGDVGIGTVPSSKLDLDVGVGTTTIEVDGSTGGQLKIRDTDDAGWTCCTAFNGVLACVIC